jgi:oligosaccharide repeat unit polymerase
VLDEVEGLLITIATIALIAATRYSFGSLRNPFALLCSWWGIWLLVAYTGYAGVYQISRSTMWLVVSAMWVFVAAALIPAKLKRPGHSEIVPRLLFKFWGRLHTLLMVLVAPVIAFFSVKALFILANEGIIGYRNATFSRPDEPSVLFDSYILEGLYALVISPVLWAMFFLGIALSTHFRSRAWILPTILLVLDSAMRLGRTGLYVVAVTAFLRLFLVVRVKKPGTQMHTKSWFRHAATLALTMALIAIIGFARDEQSSEVHIVQHSIYSGLVYHASGYVILDEELHKANGMLNSHPTFGRSALSGIERYGVLLLRRFDPSISPVLHGAGSYLDEYRAVATASDGTPVMANAFATSLFSLYRDGGVIVVLFFAGIFGFVLSIFYRTWQAKKYATDLAIVLGLTMGGWLSLFQSQFDRSGYWLLFALSVVLYRLSCQSSRLRAIDLSATSRTT